MFKPLDNGLTTMFFMQVKNIEPFQVLFLHTTKCSILYYIVV